MSEHYPYKLHAFCEVAPARLLNSIAAEGIARCFAMVAILSLSQLMVTCTVSTASSGDGRSGLSGLNAAGAAFVASSIALGACYTMSTCRFQKANKRITSLFFRSWPWRASSTRLHCVNLGYWLNQEMIINIFISVCAVAMCQLLP